MSSLYPAFNNIQHSHYLGISCFLMTTNATEWLCCTLSAFSKEEDVTSWMSSAFSVSPTVLHQFVERYGIKTVSSQVG